MQTKLLQSQAFIGGLLLLLINDFFLKYSYPGWVTGKLSDFAGLFIFPLFWMAFFPKHRRQVVWLTVLGFIWWKTPLADSFIDCWNQWFYYSIHRVVDYIDYIALVAVFFAWKYSKSEVKTFHVSPKFVTVLALFSFCATSYIKPLLYQYPNPNILVYNYKVDSLVSFEKKISTHDFELDSNGVFTQKQVIDYDPYYNPKRFEKIELEGDLILLKVFGHRTNNGGGPEKSYASQVRFMEKVKKDRQYLREYYKEVLINEGGKIAEQVQFVLEEGERKPSEIKVKFHAVDISEKDSFSIRTTAFGSLEQFYFKDSQLHGKYIRYWDDTTIEVKGQYEFGLEEGMWEYYDSTGVKIKETYYKEGELQSTILIEGNERKKGANAITKKKVIWAQFGMLTLCFLLLGISIYWYVKMYKPKSPLFAEKGIALRTLVNVVSSTVLGGAVTFFSFGIFSLLSEMHIPFGWDLSIGLVGMAYFVLFVPLFPFLYFLVTKRHGDFLWVILWVLLGVIIVATIAFLSSLL